MHGGTLNTNMNRSEKAHDAAPPLFLSQIKTVDLNIKAPLFFSTLLLLFIQTLTVWLESIYKISLTKLSVGPEAGGLLFVLSPLLILVCPARAQRMVLWGSVILFLITRGLIPLAGATGGVLLGGAGVGALLVALCLLLSRPFRFLQGDAGAALGLAILMSIALRAWGATYDCTVGRSGVVLGWVFIGAALGLFWNLFSSAKIDFTAGHTPIRSVLGPAIGLFANITVVYLVLSSPGVVAAWLGSDNTLGVVVCVVALGSVLALWWRRRLRFSRGRLAVLNLCFAITLVGGILVLRIVFPTASDSPAVVVRPENPSAQLLLNLMFLLSPVVLLNAQVACRSLGQTACARSLSVPVFLGMTLLVLLTIMSILTNVWGYVGPVSAVFRNQFHVPFLLVTVLMTGSLFLPGWRNGSSQEEPCPGNKILASLTLALVVVALAGAWRYGPVTAKAVGNPKQLTILSYNMQQGAALSGDRNWENQLALIKTINADIVGLQESDTPRPSNGNVAAATYFGAKLGYHIYFGPNTVSGTYGTAILSRFPLKNPRTFFTFSDEDEIGTAVAEFEKDGRTIAFFNSHPSGKAPKKRQAEELVRQTMPYEYVIAVGDYNATPKEESYRIVAARLKDSWEEKYPNGVGLLHPDLRPNGRIRSHLSSGQLSASGDKITLPERIDHIFISKPFRVVESFYLPAPTSQTDHPAHWAVVVWD
jgi:endonuclease/exonuclease/phosphatase family metal-dependent hydrolase